MLKLEKWNTLLKALRVIMITSRRLRDLVVSSKGRDMALGYIKNIIDCQSVSTVRRNLLDTREITMQTRPSDTS